MNYPVYSGGDKTRAIMDGDHQTADFVEFLEGLIEQHAVGGDDLQTVEYALENGTAALSRKQSASLESIIDSYGDTCGVCGETIAYSDRLWDDAHCSTHTNLFE